MKNLTEKTMNDYYTKYPEYITVSEAPAWKFLRYMQHQNLTQWSEDLYDLAR